MELLDTATSRHLRCMARPAAQGTATPSPLARRLGMLLTHAGPAGRHRPVGVYWPGAHGDEPAARLMGNLVTPPGPGPAATLWLGAPTIRGG